MRESAVRPFAEMCFRAQREVGRGPALAPLGRREDAITRPRRVIFTGAFWAADSTAEKSCRNWRSVTVLMLYIDCVTFSGWQYAGIGMKSA
jgi:hypothetical protein